MPVSTSLGFYNPSVLHHEACWSEKYQSDQIGSSICIVIKIKFKMIIMFTKPCVIWFMLLSQQTWKVSIYSQHSLHPGCSRLECFFLIPYFLNSLLLSCDFAMHQSGPSHSLIHWVWTWLSDFCFWGLWKFKILLQVLVWPFQILRPTMRRACTSDPHFLWPGLQRDLWGKPETYLHSGTKQGSPTSLDEGSPTLTNANCCWSWSSNPLATWREEPFTGKDPDAEKDWGQEEKGVGEDEMVGWHQRPNGHEFEQTTGDSEGQRSLACCSPWGCKETDMTERLNNKIHEWLHLRESGDLLPYSMQWF